MSDKLWTRRPGENDVPAEPAWGWDVTEEPRRPGRLDELLAEPAVEDEGRSRTRTALLFGALGAGLATVLVFAVLATTGGLGGGGDDAGGPSAGGASPALGGNSAVGRVYTKASPAVASVRNGRGSGTGFLVDRDGTLVTNEHVVEGASTVEVRFGDSGATFDAEVLGLDPSTDLAVLQVDPVAVEGIRPLRFGSSARVRVGDLAVAIGNPFGLDRTATAGVISSLEREIRAPNGFSIDDVLQTDAPINPGNSGGPLLDAAGQVIGVNSQIAAAGGGGNVGIGFAVPSATVREVLPRLKAGQSIRRPFLGVTTGAPSTGRRGAKVARVQPGGPGARGGLQEDDVITRIGGRDVKSPADVADALDGRRPGQAIEVVVQRGGRSVALDVELGERPRRSP